MLCQLPYMQKPSQASPQSVFLSRLTTHTPQTWGQAPYLCPFLPSPTTTQRGTLGGGSECSTCDRFERGRSHGAQVQLTVQTLIHLSNHRSAARPQLDEDDIRRAAGWGLPVRITTALPVHLASLRMPGTASGNARSGRIFKMRAPKTRKAAGIAQSMTKKWPRREKGMMHSVFRIKFSSLTAVKRRRDGPGMESVPGFAELADLWRMEVFFLVSPTDKENIGLIQRHATLCSLNHTLEAGKSHARDGGVGDGGGGYMLSPLIT